MDLIWMSTYQDDPKDTDSNSDEDFGFKHVSKTWNIIYTSPLMISVSNNELKLNIIHLKASVYDIYQHQYLLHVEDQKTNPGSWT